MNDLKELAKEDLVQLIPELLSWLQDINWPIAIDISQILLTIPNETLPHISHVLSGDDDIWKEWCLRYFVMELPDELILSLQEEIKRIAYTPTKGEELEEVHITALEILKVQISMLPTNSSPR